MTAAPGLARPSAAHHSPYTVKVLVRGASLREANGIWADCRGRLYVATTAGAEVAVLDARNGRVIDRLSYSAADDVTMGPDGSLYWTDLLDGKVWRMAPGRAVTSQYVAPGMNPITFSADGRLFVAQAILPYGETLYELDPALVDPPKAIWSPGDGPLFFPAAERLRLRPGRHALRAAAVPWEGCPPRPDRGPDHAAGRRLGPVVPDAVKFDSYGRLFAVTSAVNGEVVRIDVAGEGPPGRDGPDGAVRPG